MIIRRKTIKLNGKNYYIGVNTYPNGQIRLDYENDTEFHDITLNFADVYIDKGKVILDPLIKENGLLKVLKKSRIIKEICGTINYHNVDMPVAILNMGILRTYDYNGVNKHLEKVSTYE
jgi:hypothetical protein